MDYDDNDLHGQNFHLAGEGSTKFPPGFQPYALPKFDFDDSLQSHLRFDSLVETEVFLGIESNQDNNWIEDFSRGSSGIEFNPSAAEPCSISRRNNVWSEATSSESVEMLLKSVGQEEIVAAPTAIEELDACDELGCLTKQMEHSLKQDENILSRTEDVKTLENTLPTDEDAKDVENTLPSDDIGENSAVLKEVVVEDQSCINDTSQTQRAEVLVGGSINSFDQSADGKNGALQMNVDVFADITCDDVTKSEINDLSEKHMHLQRQEPLTSTLESVNLVMPTSDNVTTVDESSEKDVQYQTSDISSEKLDDHVLIKDAEMDNQNVDGNVTRSPSLDEKFSHTASEVETVSKVSTEASTCNVEKPCYKLLKGESGICTVGGGSKVESLGTIKDSKCEDVIISEETPNIDDHLKANKVDVPMVDAQLESGQVLSSLEPSIDCIESHTKNDISASEQLDSENLLHNPDITGSSGKSLSADIHVLATDIAEPSLTSEKDSINVDTETGVSESNEHVSISEKECAKVPNACSDINIDSSGKEVESSSSDQYKSLKELKSSTLQPYTAADSESDVAVTRSDLGSHVTSESVLVISEDGVTVELDQKSSQTSLYIVGSNLLEEKVETFSITSVESAVVFSNVEAVPGSVSEVEKGIRCDTGGPSLCNTADQSLPPENNSDAETLTNVPASTVAELSEDCTTQKTEGDAAEAKVFSSAKAAEGNSAPEDSAAENTELNTKIDTISLPSDLIPLVQPHDSRHQDQEGNGGNSADQSTQIPASELSQIVSPDNGTSSAVQNIPISGSPKLSQSIYGLEEGVRDSITQESLAFKAIDDKGKNSSSNSRAPKATNTSKEGKTGSSTKRSRGAAGKNLQPLPIDLAPKIAELSSFSPLPGQVDLKMIQDTPQASTQVSEVDTSRGRPKSTSERKSRRSSAKTTGKDNAKKGIQPKEITPLGQSEKLNTVSPSPPAIFHVMQSNEMQPYGHIDVNNNKPYFVLASSTSSLPDLNSSASPSTVFQQPFTDFQQVQLRAQIFVYGALIQGSAPEEGYMLSAFGGLDGGRSMWYKAWQSSIDRLQNQKSTPINSETPLHSRHGASSAARPVDLVSKQSDAQNIGASTPVSRSTTKISQSAVSPMIPLSSPLWNIPTPVADSMQSSVLPRGSVMDYQQALSHLHPLQTPPSRNLFGNNTSWMSQPSYRGPWMSSTQPSATDASARFPVFPSTETVQLTPVKESVVSQSSHVPSGPTVQTGAPTSVFTAASPAVDTKKATPSHGLQSAEPKTRKRKKNSALEETTQTILQSQPVYVPAISSNLSTPAPSVSQATSEKLVLPFLTPSLLDSLRKPEYDVVQRAILSEESLINIKEASKQAEDASALAATAVGHSQDIWSQLEKQKNSGLVSDFEAKLASAAVAVAAAAAVARAAAAAANVASNAALQAKLMAEEAFGLNSFGNSDHGTRMSSSESGNVLGKATPGSILRGEDRGHSSSTILTAAREAARKQVEDASAASKRAENVDAIVKAAELAAEAVSQAGKIVAMGDPMPLRELIQAGPEGYWKLPELVAKSTEMSRELFKAGGVGDGTNFSAKHSKGGRSGKKGTPMAANEQSAIPRDVTTTSENDPVSLADGISGSVTASEKETRGHKGHKVSDLTKNIVVVLESEPMSKSSSYNVENEVENVVQDFQGNSIKEGSKVEVFKDSDGFRAAWYTAIVLSLNDGIARVSYTEIEQSEGSTQLEEWVAVAADGENPPKIRIARPVTTLQYEGTRKRRRAAIGDYNWTVGDRVDAWMTNSWWEGVVTEKNKKDETSVTVHFPAQNETSIVKAWNLRPSLNWKDGEWVEWSNMQHDFSLQEGDARLEKRLKLGSPAVELKGKDKASNSSDALESAKPEESKLLELSGIEKTFNIGKSSKRETKPDTTRIPRTGLQKEGSRVVFGVPKPGKKRKFMEVSKHYVADQSNTNKNDEPGDQIKHLKYSVPQGSRGLRSDPKEKRVAESKLKGLKPGKQQTAFGRTIPQKNFSTNSASSSVDSAADSAKLKDFSGPNTSSRKFNTEEAGSQSNSEGAMEGPFVFSAAASSRRNAPTTKFDRANKGKLAPATKKLGKIDEDKVNHDKTFKSASETAEPRRSNRRIQPTSRLLEGLQSSLILPKFPSFHDKGQRSQTKHSSRGNNHG